MDDLNMSSAEILRFLLSKLRVTHLVELLVDLSMKEAPRQVRNEKLTELLFAQLTDCCGAATAAGLIARCAVQEATNGADAVEVKYG